MSNLKHLLFDCDGVLVDTEYIAAVKMTAELNKLGVDITVNHFLQNFSGTTFSSIVKHYFETTISANETLLLISRVEREVAEEVKAIDGVENMLKAVPIGKSVVSNSSVRTVEHALQVAGLSKYFSTQLFSSELVSKPKPSPDIYQSAINSLGYDPKEFLVIEDSASGVTAAASANLKVVGFLGGSHILSGHGEKLLSLGASSLVNSMEELRKLLLES